MEFSKLKKNFPVLLIILALLLFYSIPLIKYVPNWDFMAYYLSGNYLFYNSHYFEVYRAPLLPFLLGILSIISFHNFFITSMLYAFIIISIFLYSSHLFIKAYNLPKEPYYLILIGTPIFYIYALRVGTELLSLSLLLLSLAYKKQEKYTLSGLFLGLTTLTRYNYSILLPFFIFVKDWKKIIKFMFAFIITWTPWMYYNYYYFGNIIYSFLNSYALNIYFRDYMWQKLSFYYFLMLGLSLLSFPLILYFIYKKGLKETLNNIAIKDGVILFSLLFYSYYMTPLKIIRYLYPLVIPLSLISVSLLEKIKSQTLEKYLSYSAYIILLISTLVYFKVIEESYYSNDLNPFNQLIKEINTSSCYYSDMWIHLNFYNIYSRPISELCKGNKIVTTLQCQKAIIFKEDNHCLANKDYEKITSWKVKVYSFNYTSNNLGNKSPIILDHLKEYSSKLDINAEETVCKDLLKSLTFCKIISKNI